MIAWLGTPTLTTVPRGVAVGFPSALSARNGLIGAPARVPGKPGQGGQDAVM